MPKKNRVRRAIALLWAALHQSQKAGNQERAGRIRKGIHKLNPVKKRAKAVFPAVLAARTQSHDGPFLGVGVCLIAVRTCYGIGPSAPDAIGAWQAARVKHRETNPTAIPRGFPVFWQGGSEGHGHIAIAAGDGFCWSTDIRRDGFFDRVPITEIHDKWGLTLLGWTGDLNGTPVVDKVAG